MILFSIFYAAVTLVTGTLFGATHFWTSAAMTVLLIGLMLAGAFLGWRARLGGGGDLACVAFLVCAFATAVWSACPQRSLHFAMPFACAAVLFYLILGANRESLMAPMALVATAAAVFGLFYARPQVSAPFTLRHYAAGFLLLHLPIVWRLTQRNRWWMASVAVIAAAIAGTHAIAAWVALAASLLWVLRKRPIALASLLFALATVAMLVPRTRQILLRGEDPTLSFENRVRYLRTGIAMIRARPLGWGLGTTPLVFAPFRPQTPFVMPPGEVLPHLHNLPLQIATETGVLGLCAAAWFLWRARSLAVVPYLILAMADYQLDLPALLFAAAVVAALFAQRGPDGPQTRAVVLILVFCAPLNSLCGWDHFLDGHYVQAAEQLPDLIPVSAAAGASLLLQGHPREAIPDLERGAQLDRYFTHAWFHLGRARLLTGDRSGAVDAFTEALLVQPVTVFAEGWDADLYAQARARAIARLENLAIANDPDNRHRYDELHAFLTANPVQPAGSYRTQYTQIIDKDLAHSTSLLVFRRLEEPRYCCGISIQLPKPGFYIPPGIGYIALR